MNKYTVFKTGTKNNYLHSPYLEQILLLHPVLSHLLELKDKGEDLNAWLNREAEKGITLETGEHISHDQLQYYIRKYMFLSDFGYFDSLDTKNDICGRLTEQNIKEFLANSEQLTLEVTEDCNLKCDYCGYGKFYTPYENRSTKHMDISIAKKIFDYMSEAWNSNLNKSHNKDIFLSFYGGEPLMNFPLIKEMVDYSTSLPLKHNRMFFSMTSNGLLVEKYMDFLADHRFSLLISLDGNEIHNGYRVLPNGKSSHSLVIKNIEALRTKHPDYFKKYVNFATVLHNKNSVSEVYQYFNKTFGKKPQISELSPIRIVEEQKELFRKTYKNFNESLTTSQDYCDIRRDYLMEIPEGRDVCTFLSIYKGFVYNSMKRFLFPNNKQTYIPTATCVPFSKKMFITVNGEILPCERIDRRFILGQVNNENVSLDFKEITQKYNQLYDNISALCQNCYRNRSCEHCMFYLDVDNLPVDCPGCSNIKRFAAYMAAQISALENNPNLYSLFMEEFNIS